MKTKIIGAAFVALFFSLLFYSCQKQPSLKTLVPHLPDVLYNYSDNCFRTPSCNVPQGNSTTSPGATLGRVLFYDPRLSLNNTVSCASCHKQANGFADEGSVSIGYESKATRRNTPAIINCQNKSTFFWDGRANSLEDMVLMPVQNHLEMGMERLNVLPEKLAAATYYKALFKQAFGTEDITTSRISKALAQFVRSIQSNRSKMDSGDLSQLEMDGMNTFSKYSCATCHAGINFGGDAISISPYLGTSSAMNSANIGLDIDYADKGLQELTGDNQSSGAFKIPSLRNLVYTAPYMHDGRFNTIEEVIEHYNSGIQPNPALDQILINTQTNKPRKMNMTDYEKQALAAFLRALSDPAVTSDVKFSNPFN